MSPVIDEPDPFTDYYYGLGGNPKLLARSNPAPWTIPYVIGSSEYEERDRKILCSIFRHPLHDKLEQGLQDKLLDLLKTMNLSKWISMDFFRVGYHKKEAEQKNPVVVLVTVEEGQVARVEAQRVVYV